VSEQPADGRHQNVLHERGNDLPEGGADNDPDGHIEDISPHGKFLEFFNHGGTPFVKARLEN
jgi:hypothetical protein